MENSKLKEVLVKLRRKRTIRRVIAFLSVFILLITVNSLKMEADTLERLATCGMAEHLHVEECLDATGRVICGMDEHVHTDACYQQRRVAENMDSLEAAPEELGVIELGAVTEEADYSNPEPADVPPGLEAPAEELTLVLGESEDEQIEEVVSEPVEPCAEAAFEEPAFSLKDRDFALASEIATANGIDMNLVSDVAAVVEGDEASCVGIEPIDGDWVIYAARDFDEAELALLINEEIQIVRLTDGYSIAVQHTGEAVPAEVEPDVPAVEMTRDDAEPEVSAEYEAPVPAVEQTLGEDGAPALEEPAEESAANDAETDEFKDEVEQSEEEAVDQADETVTEVSAETETEPEATEEKTDEAENLIDEAAEDESVEETGNEAVEVTENESIEETGGESDEATEDESEEETEGETEEETESETAEATEDESVEETEDETAEVTEKESDEETESETDEATEDESGEEVEGETDEAVEDESDEEAEDETDKVTEDESGEGAEDETDEVTEDESGEEAEGETAESTEDESGEAIEGETDESTEDESDEEAEVSGEVVEDGASDDESAEVPLDTAVTIDLADVKEYPLSLRALMAVLEVEQAVEEEEIEPVDAPAEDMGEEALPEAEAGSVEQALIEAPAPLPTPAEAMALSVEYDDTLLSVEATEDDRLITPIASFESTDIAVGGVYVVTLRNCSVIEAEEFADVAALACPAQRFEGSTDYVNVTVEAEEGAFPEGTTMRLADVEDDTLLTDIGDAAVTDDFTEVQRVHAVDITFVDVDGNEIEPLIPISVVMTVREIEHDEAAVVVHMDDEGNAAVVESAEPVEAPAEAQSDESVAFTADAFSVYAVVVTKKLETKFITAEGETYNITVSYGPEAEIPTGAALDVREILGDEALEYMTDAEAALDEYKTIAIARFFDIRILDGENPVQPAVPVTVQAVLANDESQAEAAPCAIHFADESTDVVDAAETGETVVFRADGFSVWGLVYTVDFHYTVNGQNFDYSLPGGDCASLRELFTALEIAADDPETENDEVEDLLAAIEAVEFSDPGLVRPVPVAEDTTVGELRTALGIESRYSESLTEADREAIEARPLTAPDWALFSLAPFDTDEILTVTLKNGDSFTIAVTDAQIATRVMTADGDSFVINLTFTAEAGIPMDATLSAREIFFNDPRYFSYVVSAAGRLSEEGLNNISNYHFFDIEIQKDGEKIEPAAPVQVSITYEDALELPEGAELSVVHFADEGIELIRDLTLSEDNTRVSYEQESFSVSGTIVTGGDIERSTSENNVMQGRYMLIAVVDGERYIILNDGTLKKAEAYTDTTVEVDFPMAWMYMNGDHLIHRADAVDYNNDKLATAFYWRYLDANAENGISEDNRGNVLLEKRDNFYVVQENGRLIYPWTKIKYDPDAHTISNDTEYGPEYYIGVTNENGQLHITGLNDREHAAEVYLASITANTPNKNMQVGAQFNTVNHIDIEVEGYANVTVPLRNGTYYYNDNGTVKSIEVTPQNPVSVQYKGTVPVTREDIKNARVISYVKNGDVDEVRDDLFYVAGYSANDATNLSTNQVRIEGVYKVADLSHVVFTDELRTLYNNLSREQKNAVDDRRRTDDKGNDYYDLSVLPDVFGGGNENDFIRKLRLDNRVWYSVSAEKLIEFKMKQGNFQLYSSYQAAAEKNPAGELNARAMVTLSASFNFWDPRNECPPIYWNPSNRGGQTRTEYDYWAAGDIITSVSENNTAGIGMDFELGDKNQGSTGTLSAQITKYIVDRQGNRIHPNAPTENTFKVYWTPNIADAVNVQGKNVGAYQNWQFQPSGYRMIHDKCLTVDMEGTGSIYDYDVKPGMLYIEEEHGEDKLARTLVDQDGQTWKYVETYLETEYVWRDDGCYGMNHVSRDYTPADASYNSDPEVLGNYSDIHGAGAYNGFVEYFVYNVYEPDVDINVKKVWQHRNGTPADGPEDASVEITLGRYKLVKGEDYVDGTLTIQQSVTGGTIPESFQATYRLLKDGRLIKAARYDRASNGAVITGIPEGDYTLEVVARATGYTASPSTPIPVTISKEQQEQTANVTTTLTQGTSAMKDVTVQIRYDSQNQVFYQEPMTTSLKVGSQFKVVLERRGPKYEEGSNNNPNPFAIKINGTQLRYDYRLDPNMPENPTQQEIDDVKNSYTDVVQVLTFTVENNGLTLQLPDGNRSLNSTTVDITNNWGQGDVKYRFIPVDSSSGASEQSAGGADATDPQQGGTADPSGDDAPSTDLAGLEYRIDGDYSKAVTLKGGVWEATLHNLEAGNEYGPYLYYIADETWTPEGAAVEGNIWLDGDGHVLTSSGETELGVTNIVEGELPTLKILKVDTAGYPLTGATFRLLKKVTEYDPNDDRYVQLSDGWHMKVCNDIVSGPDGLCRFTDIEDGSYKLRELVSPLGYRRLGEDIPFTVSSGRIVWNDSDISASIRELLTFDGETYKLTVKNEPDVDNKHIKVMKRWQDVQGNDIEAPETSVNFNLKRHLITEKTKKLTVIVEIAGKNVFKEQTAVINCDNVSIEWNDNDQFDWDANRLTWYSNEDRVKVSDVTDHTDSNHGNARFELTNLSNSAQYDIVVRFRYRTDRMPANDQINQSWFEGQISGTTINITQSGPDVQNPSEVSDDNFSEGKVLNAGNHWTFECVISDESVQTTLPRYPATDGHGHYFQYYIEEDPMAGYDVSYSDNNAEGIREGLITVYNRRNTVDLTILKVNGEDEEQKLEGAKFEIRKLKDSEKGLVYDDAAFAKE